MLKRILLVLSLSWGLSLSQAVMAEFDFATALAAEGATVDSVIAAALEAGEDITAIVNALADSGQSADAITFAMVSAGADADSVVAAVSTKTGTSAESLATTLVEATINYNARVAAGDFGADAAPIDTATTTTAPRAAFVAAGGGGSPLSTADFISITEATNS